MSFLPLSFTVPPRATTGGVFVEQLWSYLHGHQAAVIAVVAVALVALYFLIKNLIKIALVFIIILVLVGGYYYLKAPHRSPGDVEKALRDAKAKTETAIDKGREAVDRGKAAVEKGRRLTEGIGKVISGEEASRKN